MPSSLVRARYLITGVDPNGATILQDAALFQEGGVIQEVGPYATLKGRHPAATEVGGDRLVALPGLVNGHHHGRGWSQLQQGVVDDCLEMWLLDLWGRRRPVDPYLHTLYTGLRMVESGTTTVMHIHTDSSPSALEHDLRQVLRAFGDLGMRVALSFGIRDQNFLVYGGEERFLAHLPSNLRTQVEERLGAAYMDQESYFGLFRELHRSFGADPGGLTRVLLAPMNVQWCSDGLLLRCKEEAVKHDTGIHLHLVESYYQKLYGLRTWEKSPVAHLADLEFLGPELSCGHGVWLTRSDLGLLRGARTAICHNPSSNLRLRSGIAPVVPMLQHGIAVALGTDSTSLNDDDDMFQEMRLATKLHRPPGIASPCLTPAQALQMATTSGAAIAFFPDVGRLEPGKRADVTLLRLESIVEPYLDPEVDILTALVFRAKGADVDTVLINGEVVVKDGTSTRVDRREVVRELGAVLEKQASREAQHSTRLARALKPHVQGFYREWTSQEVEPYSLYNSQV